jgi:hypothetical protein
MLFKRYDILLNENQFGPTNGIIVNQSLLLTINSIHYIR